MLGPSHQTVKAGGVRQSSVHSTLDVGEGWFCRYRRAVRAARVLWSLVPEPASRLYLRLSPVAIVGVPRDNEMRGANGSAR